MFLCILDCFVLHQARYKTGWTGAINAKVRSTKSHRIFRNEHTRSNPLDPKLTVCCVLYHLGAFGTVWLPYETRCKMAELVQMFEPRSCARIFRNERTWSTTLDPKLTFWCISYHLGTFGTVWLPYETLCKTGRISAKVRATKSHRIFLQRKHPIHTIGP